MVIFRSGFVQVLSLQQSHFLNPFASDRPLRVKNQEESFQELERSIKALGSVCGEADRNFVTVPSNVFSDYSTEAIKASLPLLQQEVLSKPVLLQLLFHFILVKGAIKTKCHHDPRPKTVATLENKNYLLSMTQLLVLKQNIKTLDARVIPYVEDAFKALKKYLCAEQLLEEQEGS
jgi:hypothetical protein